LPAGEDIPFVLSFNERGGGDAVEFFAARGALTAFNATAFKLVGDGPFADVTGRRYTGTVQAAAGQPANKAGWNVIEIISPGGTVEAGDTTPVRSPLQDPTRDLANTIATYQQIRAANSPPRPVR